VAIELGMSGTIKKPLTRKERKEKSIKKSLRRHNNTKILISPWDFQSEEKGIGIS
jgi:hypothetical protein